MAACSAPFGSSARSALGAAVAVLSVLAPAARAEAQEAPTPAVSIEAVEITPDAPGDDTLCQLRVRIVNRGERPVYALGFDVTLEGEALTVYEKQLFYQKLPAGQTTEVRLFNFWTTETGRARPADGVLDVAVTLREASWLEVSEEQEEGSEEPIEVWSPAGEVTGLPVTRSLAVKLR